MIMIGLDFREKVLPYFGVFFFGNKIRVEKVASLYLAPKLLAASLV